jgi:hypothetical protein
MPNTNQRQVLCDLSVTISGMRRLLAAVGLLGCGAVWTGAAQLTLDRRAIEEAIFIGQSRIEAERTKFHAPYRVPVARAPIDWIDVITPFHRVELAAETNARRGGRQFGQREAMDALRDAESRIDLIIEMSFHPLNTFVAVPLYEVEIVGQGGRRMSPRRVERFPRSGPRSESVAPVLPAPDAAVALGAGLPVVGGTLIAVLDASTFDPNQRVEIVVLDGKTELARATVDLGRMR